MKLQVTVDKLNRRKSPVTDFADKSNVVEVVNKGFTFESVAQIENNLGVWHQGHDGHWAWEKALTEPIREVNYADFVLSLGFDWLDTKAIDVTVAMIDTGIISNSDYYNEFRIEILSSNNENLSHGNFVGGIIAGKKSIIGLANSGKLFSIKYKSDGDPLPVLLENLAQALTDILNIDEPLIINISQGFNSQVLDDRFKDQKQHIAGLIKQIGVQKNKLIFCAADDNSAINDILFPASMDECISIGCIDEFSTDLVIKTKLNLLTPMVTYTSFDNSFNQIQNSGSSFSTALVSSLAACFMSDKKGISKNEFLNELEKSSVNRITFNYGNLKSFQYQLLQK